MFFEMRLKRIFELRGAGWRTTVPALYLDATGHDIFLGTA
jgi:hypothetical protein